MDSTLIRDLKRDLHTLGPTLSELCVRISKLEDRFELSRSELSVRVESLEENLSGKTNKEEEQEQLRASIKAKVDIDNVPSPQDFEIMSVDDLVELRARIEAKVDIDNVPSPQDFEVMSTAISRQAGISDMLQVEISRLAGISDTLQASHAVVVEQLDRKADSREIDDLKGDLLELLGQELEKKVGKNQVVLIKQEFERKINGFDKANLEQTQCSIATLSETIDELKKSQEADVYEIQKLLGVINDSLTEKAGLKWVQDSIAALIKKIEEPRRKEQDINESQRLIEIIHGIHESCAAKADFQWAQDSIAGLREMIEGSRGKDGDINEIKTLLNAMSSERLAAKADLKWARESIASLGEKIDQSAIKGAAPSRHEFQKLREDVLKLVRPQGDLSSILEQLRTKADVDELEWAKKEIHARVDSKVEVFDFKLVQDHLSSLSDVMVPVLRALPSLQADALREAVAAPSAKSELMVSQ